MDPERAQKEGPLIRMFVDYFRDGFSCAVASLGFDADQHGRAVGRLVGLELRGEFEAVRRDHAVVVIGGGDHRRGVTRAGFQAMQRGVGEEVSFFNRVLFKRYYSRINLFKIYFNK